MRGTTKKTMVAGLCLFVGVLGATPQPDSREPGTDVQPGPAILALGVEPAAEMEPATAGEFDARPTLKVALQAGHWRADEAPRELSGLRRNGTSWQGMHEWEVNLEIAERAAGLLEEAGYQVDVLPAVVPRSYRADLFIAIHADGSDDARASGYRVASSRRDRTGRAQEVAEVLGAAYGEVTGLRRLTTTTRRMRNYYAFNSRRYRHSIHPATVGVIIETGFLTSSRDRAVIVDDPDRAALGIARAVQAYAETELQ